LLLALDAQPGRVERHPGISGAVRPTCTRDVSELAGVVVAEATAGAAMAAIKASPVPRAS
jgi:hypothetical protein